MQSFKRTTRSDPGAKVNTLNACTGLPVFLAPLRNPDPFCIRVEQGPERRELARVERPERLPSQFLMVCHLDWMIPSSTLAASVITLRRGGVG
jgi:hypothetical protein